MDIFVTFIYSAIRNAVLQTFVTGMGEGERRPKRRASEGVGERRAARHSPLSRESLAERERGRGE